MATISKRKDCQEDIWRVQIRRKGVPNFSMQFYTEEAARSWVKYHETNYINNPGAYMDLNEAGSEDTVDPRKHPLYDEMVKDFRKVVDKYFHDENMPMENVVKATQEMHQVSLKYQTINKEEESCSAE